MKKTTYNSQPVTRNYFPTFAPMLEFFKEFGQFLLERKKWWLIPVVVVLLLVIVLVALGTAGGAASPFIYTIF